MTLVEGLSIFSVESAKEMLRTALESVTEHDRKVRYEAEIQKHGGWRQVRQHLRD